MARLLAAFWCYSLCCWHVVVVVRADRPAPNPFVGLDGAASMHGDTASSDTTPLHGPGGANSGNWRVEQRNFLSACPSVLIRQADGWPLVLCTNIVGRNPVVRLLHKDTGVEQANLQLAAGNNLLGGVYAYLDNQDRLVMVDSSEHSLIRVKAERHSFFYFWSWWTVLLDSSVSLASAVVGHCGGATDCDGVVSLSVGREGVVWFATRQTVVGIYNPDTGDIAAIQLANDERLDNSFSTTTDGRAAIVTDRALYLLQDQDFAPVVVARHEYDRGSARKPGQLSHGSGTTPTYFGPTTGTEFVTITDNSDSQVRLIVRDGHSGQLICETLVFGPDNGGTEDSMIGFEYSVVVTSTYGYPYPAVPEGAGPAVPPEANFVGGMERVDVRTDGSGCDKVWDNKVRAAALPKLSTADNLIYTTERKFFDGITSTSPLDWYDFTVVDFDTGEVVAQQFMGKGILNDVLQTAGNVGFNNVFWQGTLSGVARVGRG